MLRAPQLSAAAFCCLAVAGCAESTEVSGDCVDFYGGEVCTWATMRGGSVVEAGAVVPVASIVGAPDDHEMTWPLVATVSTLHCTSQSANA